MTKDEIFELVKEKYARHVLNKTKENKCLYWTLIGYSVFIQLVGREDAVIVGGHAGWPCADGGKIGYKFDPKFIDYPGIDVPCHAWIALRDTKEYVDFSAHTINIKGRPQYIWIRPGIDNPEYRYGADADATRIVQEIILSSRRILLCE